MILLLVLFRETLCSSTSEYKKKAILVFIQKIIELKVKTLYLGLSTNFKYYHLAVLTEQKELA